MRKSATQAPTSLATSAGREPRSAAGGPVPAPRLVLPRRYSSTPSARTRNKISSTPAPSSGSPLEPLFDTVIAQGSDTSRFPQLRARKPRRTTCPDNAARRTHPGRVRSTTNSVDSGAKHARAKSRATAVNPLGSRRKDHNARPLLAEGPSARRAAENTVMPRQPQDSYEGTLHTKKRKEGSLHTTAKPGTACAGNAGRPRQSRDEPRCPTQLTNAMNGPFLAPHARNGPFMPRLKPSPAETPR